MSTSPTEVCRQIVLDFCGALIRWEERHAILARIADGKFVNEPKRQSVAGLTTAESLAQHAQIFERFVTARKRKFASNPGAPQSYGAGTFCDVSADRIISVTQPAATRVEVLTNWGYLLPGGQTLFVLLLKDGVWRIDSFKARSSEKDRWSNAVV